MTKTRKRPRIAAAACLAAACGTLAVHAVEAADFANGNRIYQQRCVGCHGLDGKAINPAAPNFILGERMSQPDMTLMMSVKTGKTKCPPFFGMLKDQELLDTIAYIRTLRR
jgi:cytochrome c6